MRSLTCERFAASSDPFCKLTTGADYEIPKQTSVKSNQKQSCVWDETFELYVIGSEENEGALLPT
jgi:hypothetical protein